MLRRYPHDERLCRMVPGKVSHTILARLVAATLSPCRQAGDIVAQLKAGIALKTTVVRDGKETEVEARELVPGDIVILEEGSTIAADAKVRLLCARTRCSS